MINLNYRDSRPIYEQIRDELRKLIVTGALKRDEKLPSVRSLASELPTHCTSFQFSQLPVLQNLQAWIHISGRLSPFTVHLKLS